MAGIAAKAKLSVNSSLFIVLVLEWACHSKVWSWLEVTAYAGLF